MELDAMGHHNRIVAVSAGHDGSMVDDLPALLAGRRQHPIALLAAVPRFRRVVRDANADVILAHGGSAVEVAVRAVRGGGPPVVSQLILGIPLQLGRVRRAWLGRTVAGLSAIVSLSSRLGDEMRALGYQGPIEVIPNARRSHRFDGLDRARAGAQTRHRYGVPEDRALIGLVGYLVDQKDPLDAVAAFERLVEESVDAHLLIAGAGPLMDAVGQEVTRRGLDGRVSLLGHVDGVEEILAGLDVLWLTSRDEGIPGVLIEAAMAGCPAVTYPVGDVAEVVDHGLTGVVLDRRDPAALALETARLLRSPSLLEEMGERARVRSRRWAMDVVVHDYVEVFDSLVSRSGSGSATDR